MATTSAALERLDRAALEEIVASAVGRYIAGCRERLPGFVARTFGWRGAWEVNCRAAGWDLLRAPANLMLAAPFVGLKGAAAASRLAGRSRTADWLESRRLFLTSDVAREVERRLFDELLWLPYTQDGRAVARDALAEEILADPRLDRVIEDVAAAVARRAEDARFRGWLTESLDAYASTRVAAGDLATALLSTGTGALAFKQLTPGMVSLGTAVAGAIAQKVAVATFPLGSGVGGVWYGMAPVRASTGLVVGVTGGLVLLAATLSAFSGVVADPVQKHLGLHERRLRRLLDSLERELSGAAEDSRYVVRDHYVARLLDLTDMLRTAYQLTR